MLKIIWIFGFVVLCAGCEGTQTPRTGETGPSTGDSETGIPGTGGPGSGTDPVGPSGSTEDEEVCADFPWTVETKPINMLVLLDRSKSMEKYTVAGTNETYAEVVKGALDSIIKQHTDAQIVNFALNVFPSPVMCTADYGNSDEQSEAVLCQAASQFTSDSAPAGPPEVPFGDTISSKTYDDIRQVLDSVGNCGGTPITKSLQWARHYLNSLSLKDDTYVLLATDGAPSCNLNADMPCETSTPGEPVEVPAQCLDDLDSVHAAFDLAKDGYKTFVVGVGDAIAGFSDLMDVIAYTGGGHLKPNQTDLYDIEPAPEGHWYYQAVDAKTLSAALETVTNKAISCEFEVDWESIPDVDTATTQKVVKACDQMRVFGVPKNGGDKIELTYMERCDTNSDVLGWTFADHEGSSWETIEALGSDVSKCSRIKLCNSSCDQLKTVEGIKAWDGVSASFGCKPIILIV